MTSGTMTNREAIDILRVINPPRENKRIFDKFMQARDMAIKALENQEQDRWHSVVKEGNPKESNNYLVTLEKNKVMEDFYHVPDNEWSTASRIGCSIVAWCPLPEPYTEEKA